MGPRNATYIGLCKDLSAPFEQLHP